MLQKWVARLVLLPFIFRFFLLCFFFLLFFCFLFSYSQTQVPPPRTLQPTFTPARFNVGEDEETTIVTSSGPYVIAWNFRKVKGGNLYDYRIKKYPDVVVADNFRFGQHKSIVVALPDDVTMVQKANLTKPQKGSNLKDSVVDSPY